MTHKWLTNVRRDDPLEQVAEIAIRTRMQTVEGWLQRALEPDPAVESIHQLRVSVRRARAALQFFKPCLPPKRRVALNQALRKTRRIAGPLRDLDVLIEQLSLQADEASQRVTQQLRRDRKQAEPRLRKQLKKWTSAISIPKVDKLSARIRWRRETACPTWPAWAREVLEQIHARFSQQAAVQPTEIDDLHKLRIQGKRLRYALELGVGAYPPIRTQLYPTMASLQEKLGAINDLAVSVGVLGELHHRLADDVPAQHACETLALQRQTLLTSTLAEIEPWWASDPLGDFRQSWYAIFSSDSVQGPVEGIA